MELKNFLVHLVLSLRGPALSLCGCEKTRFNWCSSLYEPFRARFGITEMCRDQWNWAKKNSYGYHCEEREIPAHKPVRDSSGH